MWAWQKGEIWCGWVYDRRYELGLKGWNLVYKYTLQDCELKTRKIYRVAECMINRWAQKNSLTRLAACGGAWKLRSARAPDGSVDRQPPILNLWFVSVCGWEWRCVVDKNKRGGKKKSQQGGGGAWELLVARSFLRLVDRQPSIWTPGVVFKMNSWKRRCVVAGEQ